MIDNGIVTTVWQRPVETTWMTAPATTILTMTGRVTASSTPCMTPSRSMMTSGSRLTGPRPSSGTFSGEPFFTISTSGTWLRPSERTASTRWSTGPSSTAPAWRPCWPASTPASTRGCLRVKTSTWTRHPASSPPGWCSLTVKMTLVVSESSPSRWHLQFLPVGSWWTNWDTCFLRSQTLMVNSSLKVNSKLSSKRNISKESSLLIYHFLRFTNYLKDIMKLPAAVGERHTFNVKEDSRNLIFSEGSKVTVNEFLETMMSDPGPQCVSWLLVLHRWPDKRLYSAISG